MADDKKYILDTQIGLVTVTQSNLPMYDVDNLSSDRTQSNLISKSIKNISSQIDPYSTKDDLIKSQYVEDVNV
jgi:hypothetical protein